MKSRVGLILGFGLFCGTAAPAFAACQPGAASYDLPKQRLDTALQEFAHISGCTVDVETRQLGDRQAPALSGRYTPFNALVRLVRDSGFEVHAEADHYAVNQTDREAVKQRIARLRQGIASAKDNNTLDSDRATKLNHQLDGVWRDTVELIKRQGFLSAAEKASFERLFAYIDGQLVPATS